jgi:uncharacterized membrane protein
MQRHTQRHLIAVCALVMAIGSSAAYAMPQGAKGGAIVGAVGGAVVAGPVGAVVGGVGGAVVGSRLAHHRRHHHARRHHVVAR